MANRIDTNVSADDVVDFSGMNTKDFSELNHKLMSQVLTECLKLSDAGVREGSVPKVAGPTGAGKSWIIEAHARATAKRESRSFRMWHQMSYDERTLYASDTKEGRAFRDVTLVCAIENLVICETCDFQMPSFEGGMPYFVWKPSILYWALSLPGARAYLFYDELGHARHDVQAAMFRVVLDRALGSVALQPGVFIVAATNRIEDKAGVHEMLLPLRRRFSNYTLAHPTGEAWVRNFAMPNELDSRVTSYINNFPQDLCDTVDAASRSKDGGFACPATWHAVSNKIKDKSLDLSGALADKGRKAVKERLEYEFAMLISGDVGSGHALEFVNYLAAIVEMRPMTYLDKPALAEELTGADAWKIAAAMPELYREDKRRLDTILDVLSRMDAELFNMAGRTMKNIANPRSSETFRKQLEKCKNRDKVIELMSMTYDV